MKWIFIICTLLLCNVLCAQNLGIGTITPIEKLDVNGNLKTDAAILKSGGNAFDFLKKHTPAGKVAFRKGHGAMGMRYIICVQGCTVPSTTVLTNGPFLGEIKIIGGDWAPPGWMFCEGQTLTTASFGALFGVIGATYGGNGTTQFMLPDLRGSAPVAAGAASNMTWGLGQKTN